MQSVATLIGPGPGTLSVETVDAARKALAALGAKIAAPAWLSDGEAADLVFQELDPDQAEAAIRQSLGGAKIDCIAQPTEQRRKRLLVADMESTIIEQEMLDEIADLRGLRPAIAAITARAMNGEIDFIGALKERVGLLSGLEEAAIRALSQRITYMPGAARLLATMRTHGAEAILVSGGFTLFAEPVAAAVGFHEIFANVLEWSDTGPTRALSGRVIEPIRDREDKLARLIEQAGLRQLPLTATLAVGDGANDLPMLLAAGLGVAFRAKPAVRAAARARVDYADLTALLFAQGYRRDEMVESLPL